MSKIIITKLFLLASVMVISSTVQGLSSTSSKTPATNSNSDLISEYILRDLLQAANKNVKHNNKQQFLKSSFGPRPWFNQPQRNFKLMDNNNDEDNQNQIMSDLYASLLSGGGNNNQQGLFDDYYQPSPMMIDDEQDIGWFDGPVLPKISPVIPNNDDNNNGDEDGEELIPNVDGGVLFNALWSKYLANLYHNNNNEMNEESIDGAEPNLEQNYEDRLSQLVDKRRHIIKYDGNKIDTTTMKPSTTTTMKTMTNGDQSIKEKAKFLHKAIKFNYPQQQSLKHLNGQKEYPLLRPASDSKKNQDQDSWPSELDENTLAEEDSLKQLPKMKQQSRTIRDVLATQLDQLRMENRGNEDDNGTDNTSNQKKSQMSQ